MVMILMINQLFESQWLTYIVGAIIVLIIIIICCIVHNKLMKD